MATEPDKLNISAIATLVAILALTLIAIVSVVTTMVRNEVQQEIARKGGTANTGEYRNLAAAQHAELTEEAKWTDRQAGVLSIPVDRSMQLVVNDISRQPDLATAQPGDAGVSDNEVPSDTNAGAGGAGNDDSAPPPPQDSR